MAEATSTVAFQILMDLLINTDGNDVNEMTLKAINTLATLERSTVARERLKFEYDKGVSVAINEVEKQLRQELENYPDILEKMIIIAEKLRSDLKAI